MSDPVQFLEAPRFPDIVASIASGGPAYSTTITQLKSGHEQRNENWAEALHSWDFPGAMEEMSRARALIAFFHVMRGRAAGFRYRDRFDHDVFEGEGIVSYAGGGALQLGKAYGFGGFTQNRTIRKPDATGFALKRNTASTSAFTLDTTAGLVQLTPDATAVVTDVSKANPGVVTTAAAHGFVTGQAVTLRDILGMTEANLPDLQIIVLSTTTFSIGIDTTGFTTYVSGGTASVYAQLNDASVSLAITGITGGVTRTVTTAGLHGLITGKSVLITGVVGLTGINKTYIVTYVSPTSFSITDNTIGGGYTSGGTVSFTRVATDIFSWTGVFDVPCRFDIDDLKLSGPDGLLEWSSLKVQEIRV